MKKIIKKISIVAICLVLVFSLTACSDVMLNSPAAFDEEHENNKSSSFVAAENSNYSLEWDSSKKMVLFKDKTTGNIWSSSPEERLETSYDENGVENVVHPKLKAPILVDYIETENFNVKSVNAYVGSLSTGSYSIEKIENGFKLTMYFDKLGFSIPLTYTLSNDGLSVSVLPDEITESGVNLVYKVSIMPFMCSVENGQEDSYLFVPSGSGALIYPDKSSEISLTYSSDIYGADKALNVVGDYDVSNGESLRLPVFGVKSKDKAMFGIVEEGAESSSIDCDIGNETIGFTTIYNSFYIRGRQTTTKGIKYSEQIISDELKVTFHPLYGDEANYVGFADYYREYLNKKYTLEKITEDNSIALKFIGGSTIKKSIVGIPMDTVVAATTTEQVGAILTDLQSSVDASLVADLIGFGNSGYSNTKVAGGVAVSSKLGGKKGVKQLSALCSDNNIDLYYDYDLITFTKSGLGVSTKLSGAALSTLHQTNRLNSYNFSNHKANNSSIYFLVARNKLTDIADKALKAAKSMNLSGVGLDTLSNYCYSDFADQRYFAKAGMRDDALSIFNKYKESGLRILANDANDYSLIASNVALDIPTQTDKSVLFDAEIPFYSIVFKGYKQMYSTSLNYVANEKLRMLQSIENGYQLSYTIINDFTSDLRKSNYQVFSAAVYENQKDIIVNNYNNTKDYYSAISGATILNHEFMNEDVRKVTYSNGTVVYVNYGNQAYDTPLGTVDSIGYIYGKEAQ